MKACLLKLIRFYQRTVSPNRTACCRFTPTCSAYAHEAIDKYGVCKGCRLAVWRLLRCNPFYKGDPFDPVP